MTAQRKWPNTAAHHDHETPSAAPPRAPRPRRRRRRGAAHLPVGPRRLLRRGPQRQWKNHVYLALSKPAWACALSLLALPCFFGRGAFVGGILSLPVFAPLAKLKFAAYLIHPAVLDVLYKSSTDARVVFTEVGWYVTFLGVSAIVLLCSLVVHLFVEQPLVNLEKHLLRGEPRPPRPAPAPEARAGADVV